MALQFNEVKKTHWPKQEEAIRLCREFKTAQLICSSRMHADQNRHVEYFGGTRESIEDGSQPPGVVHVLSEVQGRKEKGPFLHIEPGEGITCCDLRFEPTQHLIDRIACHINPFT